MVNKANCSAGFFMRRCKQIADTNESSLHLVAKVVVYEHEIMEHWQKMTADQC